MLKKKSNENNGAFILLKNSFAVVLLYLFLFSPIMVFIGPLIFFVFALSLLGITQNHLWGNLIGNLKGEFLILLCLVSYCFFIFLLGGEYKPLINIGRIAFLGFIPAYYLCYFILKNRLDFRKLLELTIIIASVISVLLFVMPSLNTLVKTLFVFDNVDPNALDGNRGFGITSNHYFEFPIGLGLGFILIMDNYLRNKRIIKLISLFIVLFAIFLNARVGVIPIVLFFLYKILKNFTLKKLFLFAVGMVSFYYLLCFVRSEGLFVDMLSNILLFVDATINLIFYGELVTGSFFHYKFLFDYFIFYPTELSELIFGTGKDAFYGIYYNGHIKNSDVGYIRQLFYGGAVYLVMWLIFARKLYIRSKARISILETYSLQFFPFILFACLLLTNIKGLAFAPNVALRFGLLVFVFIIIRRDNLDNSPKIFLK